MPDLYDAENSDSRSLLQSAVLVHIHCLWLVARGAQFLTVNFEQMYVNQHGVTKIWRNTACVGTT